MSPLGLAAVQSSEARSARRTRASGDRWVAGEPHPELLPKEIATLEAGRLVTRLGAVLEAHREVQPTGSHARGQVLGAALVDGDLGVRVSRRTRAMAAARARRGRWKCADAQPRALPVRRRSAGLRRAGSARRWRLRARAGSRLTGEPQAAGARSSSRAPISRSSAATWFETDGWDSASSRAAPENERSRATARKVSTRRGSIAAAYRTNETMI